MLQSLWHQLLKDLVSICVYLSLNLNFWSCVDWRKFKLTPNSCFIEVIEAACRTINPIWSEKHIKNPKIPWHYSWAGIHTSDESSYSRSFWVPGWVQFQIIDFFFCLVFFSLSDWGWLTASSAWPWFVKKGKAVGKAVKVNWPCYLSFCRPRYHPCSLLFGTLITLLFLFKLKYPTHKNETESI